MSPRYFSSIKMILTACYSQFCYQEGGEFVTIEDNSKQWEVKRYVTNLVMNGKLHLNQTFRGQESNELYFWIGRHS